jgi:RND family efflux transporter MFP subunit
LTFAAARLRVRCLHELHSVHRRRKYKMRLVLATALCAAAAIGTLNVPGLAHEGHDHGPQTAVTQTNALPRGEASSSAFEVVAIAQGAELVIYLDRFATNEPVRDASIDVETPDGPATAVAADGAYRLKAPWLAKPGQVDLIVTATAGAETEILPVRIDVREGAAAAPEANGTLGRVRSLLQPAAGLAAGFGFLCGIAVMSLRRRSRVTTALALAAVLLLAANADAHETAPAAPPAAGADRAARGADGTVFVPKPIQRIFGVRTAVTATGAHPRSVELPGRIIPDPNASGFVQTAVGGRLSAPPGGFPRLGAAVRQGDVLAHVTPPIQQIDVSDMRQRQGELDQQISIVERRLARYAKLAPSGAIAQIQLEETRLELEGLKERRASLDHVRREPERLTAPVDGVIAEGTPVAGQIAQPNAVVFHIVDPARLWIEALSFDGVVQPRAAVARSANGDTLPLQFRGSGWAARNQSVAVQFEVQGETKGLRAGQFVTVLLAGNEERTGIAIPRVSVIRTSNGQDVVFVHTAAERFEAKAVRVEPLDGERVLVLAGLEPGVRIVVQGAELLDHVR